MPDYNKRKRNNNIIHNNEKNVQDLFLQHISINKTPVTVFLVCGVRLQGIVTSFDAYSLLLRREGHSQLVFKHSISTIMPSDPIQLFEEEGEEVLGTEAKEIEEVSKDC